MDKSIVLTDLADPAELKRLNSHLKDAFRTLDVLYTVTNPNGEYTDRQGKLALYYDGADYLLMVNVDGATTWLGVAGSASNLDDYEIGTWTMAITIAGAAVDVAYTKQTGYYTKIGNMVYCTGRLQLNSKGSSTGAGVNITGLPFTVVNHNGGQTAVLIWRSNSAITSGEIQAIPSINTDYIQLYYCADNGINSGFNDTMIEDNFVINIGCSYRVA